MMIIPIAVFSLTWNKKPKHPTFTKIFAHESQIYSIPVGSIRAICSTGNGPNRARRD